ncbi:unnamed protein product [Periconia digitata]|uniref:SnoaL-like domain-containing protein n=1 Tax=Periconia digitata TaxID=1303443 RepID=A0A9W4U3W6_9PLEO|nr:unnamed protein product [Periconia digitata]
MSPSGPQTRETTLRHVTHSFCNALLSPPPSPSDLLAQFFTSTPTIHEHGPSFATPRLPFLGHAFTGFEACESYFALLDNTLSMELPADAFPGPEGFVVDVDAVVAGVQGKGVVNVVGKGRFESKKSGEGWDEVFGYRFSGFDDEGRFERWEIWADPLSAWVAVGE